MSKNRKFNNRNANSNPKGRSGCQKNQNNKKGEGQFQNNDTTTQSAKSGRTNDVSWYANNPELLKASASFPMSTSTGEKIPSTVINSVPGILTLFWDPIVGNGDALNEAAAQTYSFVVHANSRNKSYNQSDLMVMILAGANIFASIATGIRAYGIMHRYLQQNLYTPEALIRSMGLDYDDLKDNLSNMWFDLNDMVSRISSIWVPNEFSLIQRWFWMNSNIYKDDVITKSQYYMYVQDHMYIYDEKGSDQGGRLIINNDWGSTKANIQAGTYKKWSEYKAAVNNMITALLNCEDRGIMYGDIMAAYGENNLYTLSSIPVDYSVEPQFDKEVMTQLENSVSTEAVFGGLQSYPDGSIGKLWNAVPTAGLHIPAINKVLNFHELSDPNPADIMVATRLMYGKTKVITYDANKSTAVIELWDCGSEIITGYAVAYYYWAANEKPALKIRQFQSGVSKVLDSEKAMDTLCLLAAFDWAPWLYYYDGSPNLANGSELRVLPMNWFGEFGNYTFLDNDQIHKLNVTAVKSELGIAARA